MQKKSPTADVSCAICKIECTKATPLTVKESLRSRNRLPQLRNSLSAAAMTTPCRIVRVVRRQEASVGVLIRCMQAFKCQQLCCRQIWTGGAGGCVCGRFSLFAMTSRSDSTIEAARGVVSDVLTVIRKRVYMASISIASSFCANWRTCFSVRRLRSRSFSGKGCPIFSMNVFAMHSIMSSERFI